MSLGALLASGAVLLQMLLSFLLFNSLLSFVHSEPINGLKIFVYGPVHENKYYHIQLIFF